MTVRTLTCVPHLGEERKYYDLSFVLLSYLLVFFAIKEGSVSWFKLFAIRLQFPSIGSFVLYVEIRRFGALFFHVTSRKILWMNKYYQNICLPLWKHISVVLNENFLSYIFVWFDLANCYSSERMLKIFLEYYILNLPVQCFSRETRLVSRDMRLVLRETRRVSRETGRVSREKGRIEETYHWVV